MHFSLSRNTPHAHYSEAETLPNICMDIAYYGFCG